ncbi:FKBP-type peptidyl-prolyl cis-trans isomerase FkpA, partial [Vibrio parahaemolyticus]|nr:FKBP-type peptidyl-prolyl cis-trans isomerase FkpA [Vibrio parahaemolyticus]MDF4851540.1 FKBP-type peptidyl-prolyl cis-trans isomerase FkpA [Vibrio parahaemolyticus]
MKSVLKVSLLAATVMLAVGCQKEETKPEAAPQAE